MRCLGAAACMQHMLHDHLRTVTGTQAGAKMCWLLVTWQLGIMFAAYHCKCAMPHVIIAAWRLFLCMWPFVEDVTSFQNYMQQCRCAAC